jgi:hypothetical protein
LVGYGIEADMKDPWGVEYYLEASDGTIAIKPDPKTGD